MAGLLILPQEIVEDLLLYLDPIDIARISGCCNLLRLVVYNPNDQALWRALYLQQPFDDPRKCVSINGTARDHIDWKVSLQRLIRARTVVSSPNLCRPGERLTILETLLELATYVPPLSCANDPHNLSSNLMWVAVTLRGSALLDEATSSEEERQLCARLHTYFGLTTADARRDTRVRSRAFVYDIRNYRHETRYGPLDVHGRVNWVHMQALHHVVSMHIVDLQEDDESFPFAIFPMSIPYTQIVIPPGINFDTERDWAGVEGTWRVSFCFCDHRELLNENGNLDFSIFEAQDFGEVFRSLDVNLQIVETEHDPKYPKRPIIHFSGEMPLSTSTMTGTVQMTPDGQVAWNFVRKTVHLRLRF
ncbi:hypothetical protein H0H81_010841 [Sphagnurus paluster]|uniref:F-box domain-containing protein n=1 Tax=Sphagnurus paluster TaxID=117069 RepID=A0A9P7GN91_9AGAR|nr:hypothetical protein H0H81_010841 [Sphagnurus paluster]